MKGEIAYTRTKVDAYGLVTASGFKSLPCRKPGNNYTFMRTRDRVVAQASVDVDKPADLYTRSQARARGCKINNVINV